DVRLVPFASVAGRVTAEVERDPECKGKRDALIQESVISAERDEKKNANEKAPSFFDSASSTAPGDKGGFVLQGLAPGHYRLGVSPVNDNVYVKAISMRGPGGKPIDVASTGLNLKPGDKVTGISLRVSEGGAGVRGRVVSSVEGAKLRAGLRAHL